MHKPLPPSDEGAGVRWTPLQSRSTDRGGSRDGGFCEAKDGGREQKRSKFKTFLSLSHLAVTAPSSEGAYICKNKIHRQIII